MIENNRTINDTKRTDSYRVETGGLFIIIILSIIPYVCAKNPNKSIKNDINVEESLIALAQDIYKNKEVNEGIKTSKIKYSDLKIKKGKDREYCCCIC